MSADVEFGKSNSIHPVSEDADEPQDLVRAEIFKAIREVRFGVVEVVLHHGKVTEIRKTSRLRLSQ
jgi:hypothetical protein